METITKKEINTFRLKTNYLILFVDLNILIILNCYKIKEMFIGLFLYSLPTAIIMIISLYIYLEFFFSLRKRIVVDETKIMIYYDFFLFKPISKFIDYSSIDKIEYMDFFSRTLHFNYQQSQKREDHYKIKHIGFSDSIQNFNLFCFLIANKVEDSKKSISINLFNSKNINSSSIYKNSLSKTDFGNYLLILFIIYLIIILY